MLDFCYYVDIEISWSRNIKCPKSSGKERQHAHSISFSSAKEILIFHGIFGLAFFFFILTSGHIFIAFRDRGREERETLIGCLAPVPRWGIIRAWTGDQTRNLGTCPDWKSNPLPLSYWTMLKPIDHTSQVWTACWRTEIFLTLANPLVLPRGRLL